MTAVASVEDVETMRASYDALAHTIQERAAGRHIVYIPNPGNYGDGLIRYATKLFFHDYGIRHTELNIGFARGKLQLLPFLLSNKPYYFVYGGGGSWCEAYSFGQANCAFISLFTSSLLVLPSTFAICTRTTRGVLYRRDEGESARCKPSSLFCHDMAFYLCCSARSLDFSRSPITHAQGVLMRTDRESARDINVLPSKNFDISVSGDHMSDGAAFVQQVASFGEIFTDRLHVAIAGGVAGRRVHLVPGNYFKIRAIYDCSISRSFASHVTLEKPDFDLVTYHAESGASDAS
jgi:hypothetical protein